LTELEGALNRALEAVQSLDRPAEQMAFGSRPDKMASAPLELIQSTAARIKLLNGRCARIKAIAEELKSNPIPWHRSVTSWLTGG
jgi:hypothetical protein